MIKDYLPSYMQEYREIREICSCEDLEISELCIYRDKIQREFFLETATGFGLKRTENMLGIISSEDESIEFRKFRIKTKLAGNNYSLTERLNQLIPNGEYSLNLNTDTLTLTLRIPIANEMYLNSVVEMLEKTVPLNIILNCSVLYTSHKEISKYKHSELNSYTHKYIKEELYEQ